MKKVYPIESRCINCHLCEVACIIEHSESKTAMGAYHVEGLRFNLLDGGDITDPAVALVEGLPRPLNRTLVEQTTDGSVSISTNCRHCEAPDCVFACKNGSLYVDDEGRVRLQEDKCVGCWMCVMACRYGAIGRNATTQNVPGVKHNGINHHCDLCPERDQPACVWVCPTKALVFEERGRA
ncbi:MAG: 4Fe-4S binding protein [Candidatus Latescibacteria bacterium]|nr:4Fe-4S binding protein [Candidatus Latescibacterota bacterium]